MVEQRLGKQVLPSQPSSCETLLWGAQGSCHKDPAGVHLFRLLLPTAALALRLVLRRTVRVAQLAILRVADGLRNTRAQVVNESCRNWNF